MRPGDSARRRARAPPAAGSREIDAVAALLIAVMQQDPSVRDEQSHRRHADSSETPSRASAGDRRGYPAFDPRNAREVVEPSLPSRLCGIEPDVWRAIPSRYHAAICTRIQTMPTCCITLEPRCAQRPGGSGQVTVLPGTAALIGSVDGCPVAHLFQRDALQQWFASSRSATNPMTQRPVDVQREYFVLS